MMEMETDGKKVWICLSIVVLAAVVIGAVYYMNMPKEHSEEGVFNPERKRGLCGWHQGKTLYIKGDRDVEVTKPDVTLADLLSMECSDQSLLPKLKTMKILKFKKTGNQRCVISVLKIIACIHGQYPDMEVQNLGETDMIVTYEDQKTPSYAWHLTKTAFVTAVTFCGAAFSIMAFNNDVDVTKLFDQIYHLVTGNKPGGITILEIAYSAGLMIGILIFFNHFGKRRFTVDPTPMEVQMRVYENDIQTTLIENAARKEKEIDVGKGGGIHGTGG